MRKNKKRNVPTEIKRTIAAVRKARIEAGMNNDQRFHERRVEKDRGKIRESIAKRDARSEMR
jgi:hypothetical protein